MSDFLPKDYKVPSNSKYMKLEKGSNKLRIMTPPIIGWVEWVDAADGKREPVRYEMMNQEVNGKDVKHFWAFIVWNYEEEKVQILELTQKTVMDEIRALSQDEDWGNPTEYDITIKKEGDGRDTKYNTNPKPKSPVPEEAIEKYNGMTIKLEALFTNDDPFAVDIPK